MSSSEYSSFDDFSLVEKTRDGDSKALLELSGRHSGIFYDRVAKTSGGLPQCEIEDLKQSKDSLIWEAANTFDEKRGMKFSSYLGQKTAWIIMSKKTAAQSPQPFPLSSFSDVEDKNEERGYFHSEEDYENKLDLALNSCDEKTNRIMKMRADGMRFEEIAAVIGCSRTWCQALFKEGAKKIRRRYNKLYS